MSNQNFLYDNSYIIKAKSLVLNRSPTNPIPGSTYTLWINSGDSDNLYLGGTQITNRSEALSEESHTSTTTTPTIGPNTLRYNGQLTSTGLQRVVEFEKAEGKKGVDRLEGNAADMENRLNNCRIIGELPEDLPMIYNTVLQMHATFGEYLEANESKAEEAAKLRKRLDDVEAKLVDISPTPVREDIESKIDKLHQRCNDLAAENALLKRRIAAIFRDTLVHE